jgi:hypothetical protein
MAKYHGPVKREYQVYESTLVNVPVVERNGEARYHMIESFNSRERVLATSVEAAFAVAKQRYGTRAAVSYPGEHQIGRF